MKNIYKQIILVFLVLLAILYTPSLSFSQPWTSNGTCDFTDGVQWNSGGSTPCACTWYSVSGTDTTLNCAFGDCGQSDILECVYDCNGHNGNPTDMVVRQCDATATPYCWFQGAGSTAGFDYCQGIALPVEFMGMEGYTNGIQNFIEWSTASEYNSSHYIVERSDNGENFEFVATIPSSGTTTLQSNYRAIDMSPLKGISYYKLTQYDYDGAYEVLGVISIDIRPKEVSKIINLMGQEVDRYYEGVKIIIFEDGTTIKTL